MSDEKFVTVPYDRWNSYYKKLEEINKVLLADLEREKRNKKHLLYLDRRNFRYRIHEDEPYVYLYFHHLGIRVENTDYTKYIEEAIDSQLGGKFIFKKGDIEKMEEMLEELNKKRENVKLLINKIPKIVRWIFKIKI